MLTLKGGKGGGTTFKTSPDNLRSEDTFEGVLGLAIGPIKGPKNGLQSIKLDGTAIENATGESNFGEGFIALFGDGDPAKYPQIIQLKLGAGASPVNIGVSLTNTNTGTGTGTPGPWVTRTVNNTNADFIDLRFIAQQLYTQSKSGVSNATATLEIQMKPVGMTTWVNPILNGVQPSYQPSFPVVTDVGGEIAALIGRKFFNSDYGGPSTPYYAITGKTSSPSVYEVRIAVPNSGAYANTGWDIRVRLLERETYDADPDFEKRTMQWESAAAVFSDTMGDLPDWQGVSWLQIYGKATDQLTGVPVVTGEYDTKIVSVPSNFNPATRTYTGTWDGSWSKQFTNDPAWVINDAITDSLAGISLVAPGSYLNKWDALELSKFCSVQVSDGAGGTQPRYSMNLAISEPQKAEEFIRYLAGAVGALAWDQGDGEWRLKIDKLDTPVDIYTLENIEGEFIYSHTDVDTRYNDIIGQFKNAEMDYRADSVRLYDSASIAKIGRKPTTIALVGATNRQEAMRRVMIRLRANVNEDKVVNFTTNRRGRNVDPLDLILIADGDLGDQDKRTTGRVLTISTDRKTITVRDPMRLENGIAYTLRFAVPNAAYNPDTVTEPGSVDWKKPTIVATSGVTNVVPGGGLNTTTLTLDTALPTDAPEYLVVALEATTLPTLPLMYRVTNVMPAEDGERVSISALIVDTGKQDAADNVTGSATVFQDLRGAVPPPLLGLSGVLLSLLATPADQGKNVSLVANWERPSGAFISGFRVRYRVNGGEWNVATERTAYTSFDFHNPVPGTYEVEISTLDRRGAISLPLVGTMVVTQELIDSTQITYNDGTPIENLKPAEISATDGSRVGVNLKDQAGVLISSDSQIKNSGVTITPGGQLQGAGGGTVTIGGLGYTGDLNASAADNLMLNGAATSTTNNPWWGSATRIAGSAGDPAFYVRSTAAAAGGPANNGQPFPVTAGETLYISALGRSDVGGNPWQFSMDFYNAAGTFISTLIPALTPASATWTVLKTTQVVPANAAQVFLSIFGRRNSGFYTDIANIRVARTENAATVGAQSNVNMLDQAGAVLADAAIKNSGITISAGGALSGAGGGTVTYSGLGGAIVGQQTDLRLGGSYLKDSSGFVIGDATVKNSAVTINAAGVLSGAGGGTVTYSGLGGGVVGQQSDLRLGGLYLKDSGGSVLGDATVKNSSITINAAGVLSGAGGGTVTAPGLGMDPSASAGVNLIRNADLSQSGLGYTLSNSGTRTAGSSGDPAAFFMQAAASAGTYTSATTPIPANTGKLYIGWKHWASTGTGFTTMLVSFFGPTGASSGSAIIPAANPSMGTGVTNAWFDVAGTVVVPAGTASFNVAISPQPSAAQTMKIALPYAQAVEVSATVGAQSGVNFADQFGTILTDTVFKNSGITINAAGVLSGAGGGTVTYSGLGGGVVGQQADLRLGGSYLKDSGGTILTDAATKNSAVTITSAGVLTGAGGGTVTYSGLGGGNVGLQSDLRLGGLYLKDSGGVVIGDATVKNSAISMSAAGVLSGAGGGTVTYSGLGGGNVGLQSDLRLGGLYLKDSGGTVLGDTAVKNSAITMSAGGVLSGAGGGTVTYSGLGGGAVGQQADLRFGGLYLKDSAGSVLGDSAVKNSAISMSSVGVLSGAGGGSITALDFANTSGATKPENNSTRNISERAINRNSAFADGNVGWLTSPYGGPATTMSASANGLRGGFVANLLPNGGVKSEQMPCTPGETLYFAYRFATTANRTGGAAPTWYVGVTFAPAVGSVDDLSADVPGFSGGTLSVAAGAQSGVATFVVPAAHYAMQARIALDYTVGGSGAAGYCDYIELYKDEPGSTIGAIAGTNLLDSTGAALGDSAIKNSGITISSGGVLSGAGGGTVTYSGLGGGAVGQQSDLRFGGAYLKDSAGSVLGDSAVKNSAITMTAAGVLIGAGGGTINALSLLNGPLEASADVTSFVTGVTDISIAYDYLGVAKTGELTRSVAYKLVRNGVDVTSGVTWTYSVITGTVNGFTNASGAQAISGAGVISFDIASLGTSSAVVEIKAVYSGTTRTLRITIVKISDPPPVSGGGGSGSGGASSTSTIASSTSNSYSGVQAGPLTCVAGSGGRVDLAAPLTFQRPSGSNGTSGAAGKWQWRVVGGTFADVTTEIASTADCNQATDPDFRSRGSIAVTMAKTGLTNGTTYEFQLLLRASVAVTLNYTGTASATGS